MEYDDPVTKELARIAGDVKTRIGNMQTQLEAVEQKLAKHPEPGEYRSSQELLSPFLKHASLQGVRSNSLSQTERVGLNAEIKALVNIGDIADSNSRVFPTPNERVPGLHGYALRPLRLVDVMPTIPTFHNIVEYVQVSWTGGADVQAEEGEEKAEMSFDGELKTAKIATIAVHTTASAQVLEDNQALNQELQRIMRHNAVAKLEEQIITGAGTSGRIHGLYHQASEINTNRDPFPERIGDALQQMETQGYAPNVVMLNPTDWFEISMMKDSEGRYIYGNPSAPVQPVLFNRPVITSPTIPLHRALIGDTQQAPIRDRMLPSVFISREHKDYATRNLVLILVELRAGLTLLDTGAFRRVSLDPRS